MTKEEFKREIEILLFVYTRMKEMSEKNLAALEKSYDYTYGFERGTRSVSNLVTEDLQKLLERL